MVSYHTVTSYGGNIQQYSLIPYMVVILFLTLSAIQPSSYSLFMVVLDQVYEE